MPFRRDVFLRVHADDYEFEAMTSIIAKAAIGKEYAGSLITLKAFLLKMARAECPFCAIVLTLNKMSPRDRDVFTAHLIAVHGLHLNSRAELA